MKRKGAPTILAINPGSTSTKMAVFKGRRRVFESAIAHDHGQLRTFRRVIEQAPYRETVIRREMRRHGVPLESVDLFMARGGLLRPVQSGVYAVNDRMLRDLRDCIHGEHASNLGAILAHDLAQGRTSGVYVANPVVVDELDPVARITGLPGITRRSIFHALNQKAVAQRVARKLGKAYERCNIIVAHVGGGVSVGVHRRGRVVDVNNALEGDGPFSPERTGSLPVLAFYRYAMENKLSPAEVRELVGRHGGLLAHLKTNDCRRIENMVRAGSRRHQLVLQAFVRQLAKAIGAGAAVLAGAVDAVVLTGNVLRSRWIRNRLRNTVKFIAPVYVFPGSFELDALVDAALDVWSGKRRPKKY